MWSLRSCMFYLSGPVKSSVNTRNGCFSVSNRYFKSSCKHVISTIHRRCSLTQMNGRQCSSSSRLECSGVPADSRRKTVFAVSSGHGKCGVAVIRASGPAASQAVLSLGNWKKLPQPRLAHVRKIVCPSNKEQLDNALVLWFPGPHSFTGEDCCEFHVHGGTAVVTSVLTALSQIPEMEPADPGDFTRRAFLCGKLDLTEVEGLGDLIHAETEVQRKQALRQMGGALSELYGSWRSRLVKATAHVEAFIDFSEEENIEDSVMDSVLSDVQLLRADIASHLDDSRKGERLRDGVHVTIAGEPNVGKSTLLNLICQKPAAIVSPTAGTTRDVIEKALNIDGYPVILSDTAGLRESRDDIEQEGVLRAKKRVAEADLLLLLISPSNSHLLRSRSLLLDHIHSLGLRTEDMTPEVIVVLNKIDLFSTEERRVLSCATSNGLEQSSGDGGGRALESPGESASGQDEVSESLLEKADFVLISCQTGDSFSDLLSLISGKVKKLCGDPLVGNPSFTQSRHRAHLTECLNLLDQYISAASSLRDEPCLLEIHQSSSSPLSQSPVISASSSSSSSTSSAGKKASLVYNEESMDVVLAAQSLRGCLYHLGKVTGKITSEEILDVVFRDFCIGK